MQKFCFFFLFIFIFSQNNYGQQDEVLEKGSLWAEAKVGLSFYNQEIALINNEAINYQEINNSFRLSFIPQINYAIADRLMVGAHLGFNYDTFEVPNSNNNSSTTNYKIGTQLQYYFLKITPEFYLRSEVGANYNHYRSDALIQNQVSTNTNYLKAYFDAGFSFLFKEDWMASIFLKDIFTYHSSVPNFENREDFQSGVIFQDFIHFPHFSISYKFN